MNKLKIKDIAKVGSGQSAPKKSSDFSSEGTPFIRAGSLEKLLSGADECSLEKIKEDVAKRYRLKIYSPGTVVFAKSGMSATKNRIYKLKNKSYVVSHLATLLPKDNINSDFLVLSLRRNPPSCLIKDPAYPSINRQSIENFKLLVAEKYEDQIRIATLLSHVEALIAKRKESIRLLDDLLKSTFLKMFGNPVMNEKEWDKAPLSELGTLDRGVSKHRPRNASNLLGGSHPLIQTGDVANAGLYIKSYNQTYSDIGLKQSKMWPKGTLCITIAANIAKTAILDFDACFPDSVVGFTSFSKKSHPIYVHFLFKFFQKILEKNAPQAAQKNINLGILRKLSVPKPNIKEQNKFVEKVKKVESLKSKYQSSLHEIENLYGSLSQRAFRGDLDLRKIPILHEARSHDSLIIKTDSTSTVLSTHTEEYELTIVGLKSLIKDKLPQKFTFKMLNAAIKEYGAEENREFETIKDLMTNLLQGDKHFLKQEFGEIEKNEDQKQIYFCVNK